MMYYNKSPHLRSAHPLGVHADIPGTRSRVMRLALSHVIVDWVLLVQTFTGAGSSARNVIQVS